MDGSIRSTKAVACFNGLTYSFVFFQYFSTFFPHFLFCFFSNMFPHLFFEGFPTDVQIFEYFFWGVPINVKGFPGDLWGFPRDFWKKVSDIWVTCWFLVFVRFVEIV